MIEYKNNANDNIVELAFEGKLTKADFEQVIVQMTADKVYERSQIEEVRTWLQNAKKSSPFFYRVSLLFKSLLFQTLSSADKALRLRCALNGLEHVIRNQQLRECQRIALQGLASGADNGAHFLIAF